MTSHEPREEKRNYQGGKGKKRRTGGKQLFCSSLLSCRCCAVKKDGIEKKKGDAGRGGKELPTTSTPFSAIHLPLHLPGKKR